MGEDNGARLGTWLELVRRARIDADHKFAALVFASYAANDGTNIHCSVARLAVDCDMGYSTARTYLRWLRDVGLIELTKRGNRRRGEADTYRLILGEGLLERIDVPSPDAYKKTVGELREEQRSGSAARAVRRSEKRKATDQRSPKDERYSPVDNQPHEAEPPADINARPRSERYSPDQRSESPQSTLAANSLTCGDVRTTSPSSTSPVTATSPLVGDTGRSTSYRSHARDAASKPIRTGEMDPDTARRYREAYAALATLQDLGLDLQAAIRAEFGDLPDHQVVIKAAERFAHRRTG